jgi:transaldolase/glucose-6-phosphate isomerase
MNALLKLIDHGQSYWLDNLTRTMMENGELERRVREQGLRGITSNPSIFNKAISKGQAYDAQIRRLVEDGLHVHDIYDRLTVSDIQRACDIMRPVFDASEGVDGFVSLEVSPYLIHDTDDTMNEARRLFAAVGRPNVLIKIPGSPAGVPAIEQMLYEGVNINITLLFSIAAYEAVAEAYVKALERRLAEGKDVSGVASVASFFVSRIDVLVDQLLGHLFAPGGGSEGPRPELLLGRAAVANAKLAYRSFKQIFSGERWQRLADHGARVQRVLWASTSTKDPLYSDVRYVEPLVGSDTVNTMPEQTIAAFADHGALRPGSVEEGLDEAQQVMDGLDAAGIDFDAVTWQLLNEGATKFITPYDALMATLARERATILGLQPGGLLASEAAAGSGVEDALDALEARQFGRRMFARDTALWTAETDVAEKISKRLGWLDCVSTYGGEVEDLARFAVEVKDDGIRHVVHLGMGGSSLCPEVCHEIFGSAAGFPALTVLDNTDPTAVEAVEDAIDLRRSLFIVASKSGTTTETLSFYKHFWRRAEEQGVPDVGRHFIAITDPGTPLAGEARSKGFRRVFENDPNIGGRYSALSLFGLVPMALMGMDVGEVLRRARRMEVSCGPMVPARANPGVHLGAILGMHARRGRDKVTFALPEALAPFGMWAEQLLAESTGKEGKGLLPVAGEPIGPPEAYGEDRLFVAMSLIGRRDDDLERRLTELEEAGQPVVRLELADTLDLGGEFLRWEIATATAGAVLHLNPFDEPNVAESKGNTRDLLQQWERDHAFPEAHPVAEADGLAVFGDHDRVGQGSSPAALIRSLLDNASPGDYVALLAYIRSTPERQRKLQELRVAVRDGKKVATTLGYGPRYLHSTGQLHKGGPDTGIFLIFTADTDENADIPGETYDFATLQRAQALGDFRSLVDHGRRVLRVHLGANVEGALAALSASS